jgi:hypothetical protein
MGHISNKQTDKLTVKFYHVKTPSPHFSARSSLNYKILNMTFFKFFIEFWVIHNFCTYDFQDIFEGQLMFYFLPQTMIM